MFRFAVLPLVILTSCGIGQLVAADTSTRIVGHRGLVRHAPEQTLADFEACINLRVDIELDVRRTRDGQLVCVHDESVDRTTTGTGKVSELSLREVQSFDAGTKFDPRFAGERVPTLAEVFNLLRTRKAASLLIAVDLKVPDVEADVVALAKKHGLLKQIVFIGRTIEHRAVRENLRDASPDGECAVLCPAVENLDACLADTTASWIYLRFLPTADQVKSIHAAGKRVFLVGPLVMGKEPENWGKGRAVGVDAILTDYPLECRACWRAAKP